MLKTLRIVIEVRDPRLEYDEEDEWYTRGKGSVFKHNVSITAVSKKMLRIHGAKKESQIGGSEIGHSKSEKWSKNEQDFSDIYR